MTGAMLFKAGAGVATAISPAANTPTNYFRHEASTRLARYASYQRRADLRQPCGNRRRVGPRPIELKLGTGWRDAVYHRALLDATAGTATA